MVGPISRLGFATGHQRIAAATCGLLAAALLVALDRAVGRSPAWDLAASFVVCIAMGCSWWLGAVYPAAVVAAGTVLFYGALVRWCLPPTWPVRKGRIAGPALGLLLLDMWLWVRHGSPAVFALLAIVVVTLLELWARRPAVAERFDRLAASFGRRVGTVLSTVLSSVVFMLLVLPVHVVSRMFRYSPLDTGWTGPASAWVTVDRRRHHTPDGRPAHATSMAALELRPSPSVRRRSRLRLLVPGLVVVVMALFVGKAGRLPWIGRSDNSDAQRNSGTFTRAFEDDPAFKDAPWARNVRLGLLDAWTNLDFNAALGGWTIKDLRSKYVNVTAGERATLAPDPSLGTPITVWLVGGSAAFGAGQRDDHTIASELVRSAGSDGLALRVHNFAVPATVNWQSAMLVLQRLSWQDPPDLVVVYDGANDMALQDVLAAQGRGDSDLPASLMDQELDAILKKRAIERGAAEAVLPPSETTTTEPTPSPETSGRLVLSRYGKGLEVIRQFCASRSVPVSAFWQPDLRAKQTLSGVDKATLRTAGVDPDDVAEWTRKSDAARAGLGALGVVDLTTVFDGRTDAIYWDTVHTNETGAQLVAEAMYRDLEPQLRAMLSTRPR